MGAGSVLQFRIEPGERNVDHGSGQVLPSDLHRARHLSAVGKVKLAEHL